MSQIAPPRPNRRAVRRELSNRSVAFQFPPGSGGSASIRIVDSRGQRMSSHKQHPVIALLKIKIATRLKLDLSSSARTKY